MANRKKLAVHELSEGMFVAELDRPWLDTPFLFQGFVIRSEREIADLSRYCEWVWVDQDLSDAAPANDPIPGNSRGSRPGWLSRLRDAVSGQSANDPVTEIQDLPGLEGVSRQTYAAPKTPMREELPRAEASLQQAEQIVREATQQLRISETLELSLINKAVDPVIESVLRNQDAMIWLQSMRGKGEYIFSRSVACAVWGVIFGRHLGLDRATLTQLALGGLLLDLGKVKLPDELLTRSGPLNEDEMGLVRRHVDAGVEMLEQSGQFDSAIVEMVRTHHERYNGTGYPRGLKGTEIPPLGKIAGILDTFVAMTSQRPYADAMSTYDVMRHLGELADVEFQGELVEQFIQAIGMFPTGSLVELSTGEVAIVTRQNRVRRLRPEVMVVTAPDKQMLDQFRRVNLRSTTTDPSGQRSLWITHGLPPGSYGIEPEEFFL